MSNSQLSIQISRTSVHVAEVLASNQSVEREFNMELFESNAGAYREKLKAFFDQLPLKENYNEYTLAWESPMQTLVPLSVYNESSSKHIFSLMFGEDIDENTVDFTRLMELGMVSVYEIPDWVKSFFIMRFPRITIRHEHAMIVRALFQRNTFKRKVVLTINDHYLNIDVIHRDELHFSNSFEYQNAEDIIYYLLFVLEQEKLTKEEGDLQILFAGERLNEIAESVKQQLIQLKPFDKVVVNTPESVFKLHTLCV